MGNKIPTDINMFEQACSMNYKQMTNEDVRPAIPAPIEKTGEPKLYSPEIQGVTFTAILCNTPNTDCIVDFANTTAVIMNPISSLKIMDTIKSVERLRYLFTASASKIDMRYNDGSNRYIKNSSGTKISEYIVAGKTYLLQCDITWSSGPSASISTFVGTLTEYTGPIECEIV